MPGQLPNVDEIEAEYTKLMVLQCQIKERNKTKRCLYDAARVKFIETRAISELMMGKLLAQHDRDMLLELPENGTAAEKTAIEEWARLYKPRKGKAPLAVDANEKERQLNLLHWLQSEPGLQFAPDRNIAGILQHAGLYTTAKFVDDLMEQVDERARLCSALHERGLAQLRERLWKEAEPSSQVGQMPRPSPNPELPLQSLPLGGLIGSGMKAPELVLDIAGVCAPRQANSGTRLDNEASSSAMRDEGPDIGQEDPRGKKRRKAGATEEERAANEKAWRADQATRRKERHQSLSARDQAKANKRNNMARKRR